MSADLLTGLIIGAVMSLALEHAFLPTVGVMLEKWRGV